MDTHLEWGHPRIISAKFGWYWLSFSVLCFAINKLSLVGTLKQIILIYFNSSSWKISGNTSTFLKFFILLSVNLFRDWKLIHLLRLQIRSFYEDCKLSTGGHTGRLSFHEQSTLGDSWSSVSPRHEQYMKAYRRVSWYCITNRTTGSGNTSTFLKFFILLSVNLFRDWKLIHL
jgi:hypothetical protein